MSSVGSLLALLGVNVISVMLNELVVRNDNLGISEAKVLVVVLSLFLCEEVL